MTTIAQSVLEAVYGEDAAIESVEPAFDRQTLVFVVGPRAPRPRGRSSSRIRKAIDRRASMRAAGYSASFDNASSPNQ